jgi:hypothetical protein
MLGALNLPHVTDTLICVGSYVVSEFAEMLVRAVKDPRKIFEAINKHFSSSNCSPKAKAMMLNSLSKLAIKYDSLKDEVQMLCHLCSEHWNPDVQQRGVEFLALFNQDLAFQAKVVSPNPVFSEEQQQSNPLLIKFAKMRGKKAVRTDQPERSSVTTASSSAPQAQSFQTMSNAGSSSMTSHPLAQHPFFRLAIDRLCSNHINLLEPPGKLELKPYWKEALFKKTAFEGCEMR